MSKPSLIVTLDRPASSPPLDRRLARTRGALLQAAQSLFAARSVEGVTIDDIVAAAGVAKGSFYNHFSDKEAVADRLRTLIQTHVGDLLSAAVQGNDDGPSRIAAAMARVLRFGVEHPESAGAISRLDAGAFALDTPLNKLLVKELRRGIQRSEFPSVGVPDGVLLIMGVSAALINRAVEDGARMQSAIIAGVLAGALRSLGVSE
jgi:AcrR family transcriptional regulator